MPCVRHHLDLDPVKQNSVKHKVVRVGDDLTPSRFAFAGLVHERVFCQWFCAFVDHSAKSLCSLKVVFCDEGNDFQQVLFGIRMPDDRQH